MNEGDSVTITLLTTNVPTGTKVGYAMTHPIDMGKASPLGIFEIDEDDHCTS